MKKLTFLLVACAVATVATTQVMAQKINAESTNSQLVKLDAEIANPKKNVKSATWLKHADGYYAAGKEPVKSLYVGAPMETVKLNFGKAKSNTKVTVGNKEYELWKYNYVDVYASGDVVAAWVQTKDVKEGAFDVAVSSYIKARDMDSDAAAKAEAGIDKIVNHYREMGNIAISLNDYPAAAEAYMAANKALVASDPSKYDAQLVYTAGYLLAIDGGKNKASYTKGEEYLKDALANGYNEFEATDESVADKDKGGIYYYIYYCVVGGETENTLERLIGLKELMIEGVTKYPANENIMSGLMQLYSSTDGIGEPDEVLTMIEKALELNPDNLSVWYSRGRVYSTMKNYDECIKSFENVIRIDPTNHSGYFYVGLFHTSKADAYNEIMREKTYTKQSDYDTDNAVVNAHFLDALPYLEKALEIKPDDVTSAEYLKSICFRLRDEEGIMDKYNKYNEIYKSLTNQ